MPVAKASPEEVHHSRDWRRKAGKLSQAEGARGSKGLAQSWNIALVCGRNMEAGVSWVRSFQGSQDQIRPGLMWVTIALPTLQAPWDLSFLRTFLCVYSILVGDAWCTYVYAGHMFFCVYVDVFIPWR